jgi:hypothetical protein
LTDQPANTGDRETSGQQSGRGRTRVSRQAGDRQSVDQIAELDIIYDFRRTCLLNELYYARRLVKFSRIGLALEIAIIVGSGASGVSGWFLWSTGPELRTIWGGIAALSTLLAAIKPAIQIDRRIRRYSELFSSYRELSLSMATFVEDIVQFHGTTSEMAREVARLRARYRKLGENDDPQPSGRVIKLLQEEVKRRVPVESLWYPEPEGGRRNKAAG